MLAQGPIGAKNGGFTQVDVLEIVGSPVGVPVNQDANAAREGPRNGDLLAAQEGHAGPPELARGERGKRGVQIARAAEDHTGDIIRSDLVGLDEPAEELAGGIKDEVSLVGFDGDSAADSSTDDLRHS